MDSAVPGSPYCTHSRLRAQEHCVIYQMLMTGHLYSDSSTPMLFLKNSHLPTQPSRPSWQLGRKNRKGKLPPLIHAAHIPVYVEVPRHLPRARQQSGAVPVSAAQSPLALVPSPSWKHLLWPVQLGTSDVFGCLPLRPLSYCWCSLAPHVWAHGRSARVCLLLLA